jgi:hypothetical protein
MATRFVQCFDPRTGQIYYIAQKTDDNLGKVIGILSVIATAFIGPIVTVWATNYFGSPPTRPEIEIRRGAPADACVGALEHWRNVRALDTQAAYKEHIRRYASCDFAELARGNLAALERRQREAIEAERARAQQELQRRRAEQAERERIAAQRVQEQRAREAAAYRLQQEQARVQAEAWRREQERAAASRAHRNQYRFTPGYLQAGLIAVPPTASPFRHAKLQKGWTRWLWGEEVWDLPPTPTSNAEVCVYGDALGWCY